MIEFERAEYFASLEAAVMRTVVVLALRDHSPEFHEKTLRSLASTIASTLREDDLRNSCDIAVCDWFDVMPACKIVMRKGMLQVEQWLRDNI